MTHAQREALAKRGIDPWSLEWHDAKDIGFPTFGLSEAAVLPDGSVMLANGVVRPAAHSVAPEGTEQP